MTNDDWTGYPRTASALAPRRRAASAAILSAAPVPDPVDSDRMDVDDDGASHGAQCRCTQCHLRTARFPRRHDGRIVLPDPALLVLAGLEGPGRARAGRRRVSVADIVEEADADRGEGSSTGRRLADLASPRTRLSLRRPGETGPYAHGADDVAGHASGTYYRSPASGARGTAGSRRPSLSDRTRPHRTSKPYDARLGATSDCEGSPLLGNRDPVIRPEPWPRVRSTRRHATSPIVGMGQQSFRALDDPSPHSATSPVVKEGSGRRPSQTSSRLPTIIDSSMSLGALYNATTLSHPLLPRNLCSDARHSPSPNYYSNQASNPPSRPSPSTHSLQSRYQSLPPSSRDLSYANVNPISSAEGPPFVLREVNYIPRKNTITTTTNTTTTATLQQQPEIYSQTNISTPTPDLPLTSTSNSIPSNPNPIVTSYALPASAVFGHAQSTSSNTNINTHNTHSSLMGKYTGASYGARRSASYAHGVPATRPLAAVSEESARSGGAGASHAAGRGTRTPSSESERGRESVSPRAEEFVEEQGAERASGLPGVPSPLPPPVASYYRRRSSGKSNSKSKSRSPAGSQEEGATPTPGDVGPSYAVAVSASAFVSASTSTSSASASSASAGVRFLGPETPQSLLAKVTAASAQRAKQQREREGMSQGAGMGTGTGSGGAGVGVVKWEHDRKRRQGYFAADDEGEEKSPFRHYNKTNYD